MIDIEIEVSTKLREKRARKKLTLLQASNEVGISAKTLSLIEQEKSKKVNKTIYKKIVEWLL